MRVPEEAGVAGEFIEQLAIALSGHAIVRLVLPVDLQHRVHGRAELAHGDERAVDEHAPPAVRRDLAFDDQLHAVVGALEVHAERLDRFRRAAR